MDSSCQPFVRAKPCAGAFGSSALARNHGKQIGIPPRIAWPSCQRDFVLRNRTSSFPAGFQEVACAPCRYISPSAPEPVIWILGRPPLPSLILTTPGIPKRWSSSTTADIVFIVLLGAKAKNSMIALMVWMPDAQFTRSKRKTNFRSSHNYRKLHRRATSQSQGWQAFGKCQTLVDLAVRILYGADTSVTVIP